MVVVHSTVVLPARYKLARYNTRHGVSQASGISSGVGRNAFEVVRVHAAIGCLHGRPGAQKSGFQLSYYQARRHLVKLVRVGSGFSHQAGSSH